MSEIGRNGQLLNESSILSSSSSLSNGGFRDTRKRNCWHQCWAWARDGFTIIACCYGILTAAITVALAFQIRFGSPQVPPAGAVASDDGECSKDAGLAMLRKGGSAVDAAVAALLCLSVTHPHLVGPGGGGVMLVHDHVQNRTRVIDFLPDIPANFDPARRTSFIGGESVGVPGFLHGLHRAHQRYGKLPWEALFSPAIEIANGGFSVSASLEDALVPLNSVFIPAPPPLFPGLEGSLKTSAGTTSNTFSSTFVPFGVRLKRGATVKRILYARLLEKVAKFGPEVVFELDYAVEMVELLKESGSSISVADLHGYQVREYDAVWSSYSNKTVFTTPGAGDVLLAELRLLANSGVDSTTPLEELYEHLVQGLKLAQPIYFKMAEQLEQRARLSAAFRNASEALDLHLVYQDVSETSRQQQQLLDGQHEAQQHQQNLAALRKLMDGVDAAALRRLPQHAATQVSAIDTYDLYVTAVAGLGSLFGSQLMSSHGVLFNNMLASVPLSAPSSATLQQTQGDAASSERVRPLVPYAPFILVDDLKVCGQRVVCSSSSVSDSVQVLIHHLLRELPLTAAVAQPRVALDPSNDLVLLDDLSYGQRLSGSVRNFLVSSGYQLGMNRPPYSSVNSVAKLKDETSSHSDPRGGGLAARLGSGGVDYQKGTSFSSAGVRQTGTHVGVAAGSDVGGADEHATLAALNISNPDAEFFEDAGGSDNIADEGNPHATLQFTQGGGHIFENAPTAPDYSTDIMKKKVKELTTERSSSVNKKYIGDAGAFEKAKTPSQGTGRVVKGDARGGVRLVYHELEEKLKGASSDPGADGRVNGGRGGNSSFELFNTGQSSLTSSKPAAEPPLPAAPPVDSVFSDYDPLRHLSQVRVDDYQTGEEEERFTGPDGYVEAPVNIWGHPESRLVSPPAHIAVLPGHLATQFRKQIEKQQLAEQRRQKLATHFQQQQSGHSPSPLPVVFGPEQPGSGLPVIVQRHRDHSHPILGSEVSGPYEDILG